MAAATGLPERRMWAEQRDGELPGTAQAWQGRPSWRVAVQCVGKSKQSFRALGQGAALIGPTAAGNSES